MEFIRFKLGASQTEVAQFGNAVAVQQDVCWFNISVHDVALVQEIDRKQQVVEYHDGGVLVELHLVTAFERVVQVQLLVLHDHDHALDLVVLLVDIRNDDVVQCCREVIVRNA